MEPMFQCEHVKVIKLTCSQCEDKAKTTKSKRQEKVEELAKHLENLTVQMLYGKGIVTNEQLAEAALEWVRQQIQVEPWLEQAARTDYPMAKGYNQALFDVRKNLLGE